MRPRPEVPVLILSLLACTCRNEAPRPQVDVPDVDRTSVVEPTCWSDDDGFLLELEVSASADVRGAWTLPGGPTTRSPGHRSGRTIVLDGATAELLGRTVAWTDESGRRMLQRTTCPVPADGWVHEVCDASAAVAWRGRWIVADDERNVLRLYAPGGGRPLQALALQPLLPGVGDDELDLEGMALDGDLLWIVGSHDSGKKHRPKDARGVLASLRLSERDGAVLAEPVDVWRGLRQALDADPRWTDLLARSVGRTSKDVDGFSVEGLAVDPGVHTSGPGLLIGLRAPVLAGRAIVLPLTPGPAGARTWAVGAPVELDLGGQGVRSLEREEGGWRGVSGEPTAGGGFGTFRWADDGAIARGPAPDGLSPEALWHVDGGWWVLSDDGNVPMGDQPCKKADESVRRARWARLP